MSIVTALTLLNLGKFTMTLPDFLVLAGMVALLAGICGGGIKVYGVASPSLLLIVRIIVSIIGVVLIAITIWLSLHTPSVTPTNSLLRR